MLQYRIEKYQYQSILVNIVSIYRIVLKILVSPITTMYITIHICVYTHAYYTTTIMDRVWGPPANESLCEL